MIWFTLCISKRYSPLPARFAPGVRASLMSLSFPVPHLRIAADDEAQRLAEAGDLAGVRVFADLDRLLGADGQVAQLRFAGVDDLVRGLRPAGRTGDDVAGTDREGLGSDAHFTGALDDVEHFLVDAMAVEGIGALSGRHRGQVVAELLRADARGDHADARFVALGRASSGCKLRRPRL